MNHPKHCRPLQGLACRPLIAKKLVEAFGRDTLRVLDAEPERLSAVRTLSAERVRLIREGWAAA